IKNGIGIRLWGNKACRVIRLIKGQWVEIGSVYDLPVDENTLVWTKTGIPATILAVALRVYELDNPGTPLRSLLHHKEPLRQPFRAVKPGRKNSVWSRELQPVTGD